MAAWSLTAVLVGLSDSFWTAVPLFLVITFSLGVMTPVRQAYVYASITSEHRATVISCDAMVGSVGRVGGQPALGRVADRRSFSAGFVIGGLVTLLLLPVLCAVKELGGAPDHIVGSAQVDWTSAAAGLPPTTQVESRPQPDADASV